jgi:hypothetical protein
VFNFFTRLFFALPFLSSHSASLGPATSGSKNACGSEDSDVEELHQKKKKKVYMLIFSV